MLQVISNIHSFFLNFVLEISFLYFYGLALFFPFWLISLKSQIRQYYNLFNYFYRFVLIWTQVSFVGAALISQPEQMQSNEHIDYLTTLAIITWIVEQSNVLAIYLSGKKITSRRFYYGLCSFTLLFQNLLVPNALSILFLCINYMCDLSKNIISLFYYDRKLVYMINKIIKPIYFILTLCLSIFHFQDLLQFSTMLFITSLNFYDAVNY